MTRRGGKLACILTSVLLSGCEDPAIPLRGDPYPFALVRNGQTQVFHWPADRLPVLYYAEDRGTLREYVDTAISRWESQFLYGELRGLLTGDSLEADVIIRFEGDTPPEADLNDAPPVNACGGTTSFPMQTADSVFTDRIRISLRWFRNSEPSDIANCLLRVTVHEVGHSIGILRESPNANDLMSGLPRVAEPSESDRITAQTLYHTPSDILPWERPR